MKMEYKISLTMEDLIEMAKLRVIKAYERRTETKRRWLTAELDSYDDPAYRIQIFVLEGSPAKGYVIADYGRGVVKAFDAWHKCLYTYRVA
jgi:hypothetical protein